MAARCGAGKTQMTVKTLETSEEIIVLVDGDLDLSTITAFKIAVQQAFDVRQDRALVIDLRETEYIDSAGLEQLLVANRKLMAHDRRLIVRVHPESQPHTVLRVTGFDAVMDVEPVPDAN